MHTIETTMNKNEFYDEIRMRYGWPIERLPSKCDCGEPFTLNMPHHVIKVTFVTLRHNHLKNMIASQCFDRSHDNILYGKHFG